MRCHLRPASLSPVPQHQQLAIPGLNRIQAGAHRGHQFDLPTLQKTVPISIRNLLRL